MHFTRVERNSDEELFSPLPTFSTEDLFLKEYCLCAEEANQLGGISKFTDVHCNLSEPKVQCKNTRTPLATSLYQECHTNRRRKRAVDNDDVFEDTPLTYDSIYDPDYIPPVSLSKLYIYIYIYVCKLNQTVLELDFRAVKFLFFPRRDLNPHH
jgi:hypothetical protein